MVDVHTHCLPFLDDGAKSVPESLSIFAAQLAQGVDTVVATPHFYAERMDVPSFLERRASSLAAVQEAAQQQGVPLPRIILGAEVRIAPDLSQLEGLDALCAEGTNSILLELPYFNWHAPWIYDEIYAVIARQNLRPVIAHLERYIEKKSEIAAFEKLFLMETAIQVNAESVLDRHSKKVVDALMQNGHVQVIGSDCHNLTTRKPCLFSAMQQVEKRYGNAARQQLLKNAEALFCTENER